MKHRLLLFVIIFALILPAGIFSQPAPAALRDFVGLINQSYHPGIVSIFEEIKTDLERRGERNAVRAIEIFLSGAFGSGFLINDAQGNLYVVTNHHVIAHAHTISITFERPDGFRRTFENLRIIATDEEVDLALLAFAPGDRPAVQGFRFLTRPVREGENVFAAGFPGLGVTPVWQFSGGMVSNASARFPRTILDDTLIGPFIQHTAQIDPGNSGGPLLVAQTGVPSGYAVAGINTLTGVGRQAANFAIPADTAQTFINSALNQRPENFRAELDQRLAQFVEGLGVNRAVYPHIATFLSSACVGENAEFAIDEMFERGGGAARRAFINKLEESVISAMGYAVAWTIENSIRTQGVLRASIKEVTGSGEEYTVVFTINNNDHSSVWVREHGNWRIRSFGTIAAGDRDLITQRQARRERSQRLRIDPNSFHIAAGYAHLFGIDSSALYISIDNGFLGANFYFAGSDFWSLGASVGWRWSIPAGNFGFMPYIRGGITYMHCQAYSDFEDETWGAVGFPIAFMGQAGLRVTSAHVPGLFGGIAFQYNIFNLMDNDFTGNTMTMALSITIGYAFR